MPIGPLGPTGFVIQAGGGGYTGAFPSGIPKARIGNTNVVLKSQDESIVVELIGVHSLTLSQPVDAPEYTTDPGFKISDHLALNAPSFSVECTLTTEWSTDNITADAQREDTLKKLLDLMKKRELFILICDFGEYNGMMFNEFEVEESENSANSYDVSFTIRKTIKATITVSRIQFQYDPALNKLVGVSTIDGGVTEITLTAFSALSEEDRSMLDKIWDIFGGF